MSLDILIQSHLISVWLMLNIVPLLHLFLFLFHTACLSHSTSRSDSWRFRFGFSFISTRSLQIVDLEDKNNLKEY